MMEAENGEVMPEDYTLLASPDNRLVWILKNGTPLRSTAKRHQKIGLPVWFYAVDKVRAIHYAIAHFQSGLSTDQEVPQECL
jgi:hypothetical protein